MPRCSPRLSADKATLHVRADHVGALVRPGAVGAEAAKDMLGPEALKPGLLRWLLLLLLLLLLLPMKAGTGVAWGGKGLGRGKGSEKGKGAEVDTPWLLCLSAADPVSAGESATRLRFQEDHWHQSSCRQANTHNAC